MLTSGWVATLCLAPYLARRYGAARAWGWLAAMFALPWVGILLYLALGRNPLGKKQSVRYLDALEHFQGIDALWQLRRQAQDVPLSGTAKGIARLATAGGALPVVSGNQGLLLPFDRTLDSLLTDIRSARNHVHLAYYIFYDDAAGRKIEKALADASARGVACRVLVDAVGSRGMLRSMAPRLARSGVEVRPSLPINPLRRRLTRFDLRNHRKVAVIDGRIAYLGSWNIGAGQVSPKPDDTLRDLTVRLAGPVVAEAALLFLADWSFEVGDVTDAVIALPPPSSSCGATMQIAPSGPMYPSPAFRDVVVFCIHQAKREITMVTPYFIPDDTMMLALRMAAKRGVEVTILIPRKSDHRLVDSIARSYARELTEAGAVVCLHEKGLLHAKAMTVDDAVGIIGSANLDLRSFHLNVEANVLVYSEETVARIREVQEGYIAESTILDATEIRRLGRLRRLGQDVARLLSPLM